jgi:hypothetical protein
MAEVITLHPFPKAIPTAALVCNKCKKKKEKSDFYNTEKICKDCSKANAKSKRDKLLADRELFRFI